MTYKSFFYTALALMGLMPSLVYSAADNPLASPSGSDIQEGRAIVARMINNPRGPYSRLRWYCKDGTVHPPTPFICKERGGGLQHAQFSADRERLLELGWPVGTIYAAMDWQEFAGPGERQVRMRDLPIEKFLVETQSGWVLKKAQGYRGYIQIEDEEHAGLALLVQMLEDATWLDENFLLAKELVSTVPHGAQPDLLRSIRHGAQSIAESDASFEPLRIEIHTVHSRKTAGKVSAWIAEYQQRPEPDTQLLEQAGELAELLEQLYGNAGRQARLEKLRKQLVKISKAAAIAKLLSIPEQELLPEKVNRLASALAEIRELAVSPLSARQRLQLLDAMADIDNELRLSATSLLGRPELSRLQLLAIARDLTVAAYGEGLLSLREKTLLVSDIDRVAGRPSISIDQFMQLTQTLSRSSAWGIGLVRYTFAESLVRFTALEPAAAGFVDDLLRSSPLLLLADVTRRLSFDAQYHFGVNKIVNDKTVPALLVLNPGVAEGVLRIVDEADLGSASPLQKNEIVVLSQTLSDLPPVAGMLTLGEGNLLSHVQLLARNFGIPNVSLTPAALPSLEGLAGKSVVLIAGSDGSVILMESSRLNDQQRALLQQTKPADKLRVPDVDLAFRDLLPIDRLRKNLSGVLVGPKAANLGELNAQFPGRVAPAVAIPFGVFFEEMARHEETRWSRLATLYADRRSGVISEEELSQGLADLRSFVEKVQVSSELREKLVLQMQQVFGEQDNYGVFIRSDTNVEDLPGFTGAGLSETIPNVVGMPTILTTIPRVWASVLSPRAITWRANLLENPEQVYPSVLLMKSVPAQKSGVLVTKDLINRGPGITVSTAWGVGGAVAGEAAETLLLLGSGERLISEAKAPYQRNLPATGGVAWKPAAAGSVLTSTDIQQLRALVNEVSVKMTPATDAEGHPLPWDIEFGFVDGELNLFQIRPLVERIHANADQIVKNILPTQSVQVETIDLTELPSSW